MAELRRLTDQEERAHHFQCSEHCHICGEKFDITDTWGWVQGKEEYNISHERQGIRMLRVQWHVDCYQEHVRERGLH